MYISSNLHKVVVRFVDIDGIVDHDCLNILINVVHLLSLVTDKLLAIIFFWMIEIVVIIDFVFFFAAVIC
jgi:hypothetical protein